MTLSEGNDLRSLHFAALTRSLHALAIAASDQLTLFPESAVNADDLARDFDYCASLVRRHYGSELSASQVDALAAIEQKLGTMSRDGAEFDPDLWTASALSSSPQWDDVRRLAAAALELFSSHTETPSLEESGT